MVVSLGLGTGLALSVLGPLRFESLWPLVVRSSLYLDAVRDAGWRGDWPGRMWSAGQIQAARLQELEVVLLAVAALGLTVACGNVIVLSLVRSTTRRYEMALRIAVGGTRARITGQLLTEGVLLSVAGGSLGLALGWVGSRVASNLWPHGRGGQETDPLVLLVAVGVPTLAAVVLTLVAATSVLRRWSFSRALTGSGERVWAQGELILQDFLAVAQLAVSAALIIGAALLIRSAVRSSESGELASEAGRTLTVQLDLAGEKFQRPVERAAAYEGVLHRVGRLSAVEAESLATPGSWIGLGSVAIVAAHCGSCSRGGVFVPILPAYATRHAVSPGYFRAMGVPTLSGREFDWSDGLDAPRVMVVNRTFAEGYFQDGDPLGRAVQVGGQTGPSYRVVGVVDDTRGRAIGPASRPEPAAYFSILQEPPLAADLAVRARRDTREFAAAVIRAVSGGEGSLQVSTLSRLDLYLAHHAAPFDWFALLLGVAGALSLLLGVHGSYTVMRYKVSRRSAEFGVRRAAGARRGRIVGVVLLQSLALSILGVGLGILGAILLAGWLQLSVPGLRPFDAEVYIAVTVLLVLAAVGGGLQPARYAARVTPAVALRAD